MKKVLAFVLLAVMLMTAACSSGNSAEKALIGTWNIKNMEGEGTGSDMAAAIAMATAFGAKMQFVFEKDGKGQLVMSVLGQEEKSEFTWKVENGKLSMDNEGDVVTVDYQIDGDSLTMDIEGNKFILEKAK